MNYLKITETCPVCGTIARTLYFRTNNTQKIKDLWLAPTGRWDRRKKCHKQLPICGFAEGTEILTEIQQLPYVVAKNWVMTWNF